jgi:hypothetical protein
MENMPRCLKPRCRVYRLIALVQWSAVEALWLSWAKWFSSFACSSGDVSNSTTQRVSMLWRAAQNRQPRGRLPCISHGWQEAWKTPGSSGWAESCCRKVDMVLGLCLRTLMCRVKNSGALQRKLTGKVRMAQSILCHSSTVG